MFRKTWLANPTYTAKTAEMTTRNYETTLKRQKTKTKEDLDPKYTLRKTHLAFKTIKLRKKQHNKATLSTILPTHAKKATEEPFRAWTKLHELEKAEAKYDR